MGSSKWFHVAVPHLLAGSIWFLFAAANLGAATYYVDCEGSRDVADGLSPAKAWSALASVNNRGFAPGDSILLRRGTRCAGSLMPKGSGKEGNPIRIGAYGSGALPVVSAGDAQAALWLFDQEYWEIENLETSGGNPYGLYIGGAAAARTLRHLHIRNLVVHDVGGEVKQKASGLVVIAAPSGVTFEDILVDGVTAYNTTQWAGIYISGSNARARNVVVRNSIVHDVYGDGIVLFLAENGIIEKSAAWLTGLQPKETIGTPNGIWTWTCRKCVVENTEGFWTDSPGVDGGVYDIDWGNDDNTVQHNYGHDAQGYCLAVFGAGKGTTTNSVLRHNVCVNNGRSPKLARRQGDMYTSTWDGGSLDGVVIEHNTFIWNPPIDAPALQMSDTAFTGTRPNIVSSNLIYSAVPSLIRSGEQVKFARNLYWHAGHEPAKWSYGGREYAGFDAWRSASPDDLFADPKLGWLLHPRELMAGVGAALSGRSPAPPQEAPAALPRHEGSWMLLLFAGKGHAEARSQLVFLQTALAQYRDCGLEAGVVVEAGGNLPFDWNFGAVRPIEGAVIDGVTGISNAPVLLLISPGGEIARRWDRFAPPADLGLTLKHYLGSAPGNPGLEIGDRSRR